MVSPARTPGRKTPQRAFHRWDFLSVPVDAENQIPKDEGILVVGFPGAVIQMCWMTPGPSMSQRVTVSPALTKKDNRAVLSVKAPDCLLPSLLRLFHP